MRVSEAGGVTANLKAVNPFEFLLWKIKQNLSSLTRLSTEFDSAFLIQYYLLTVLELGLARAKESNGGAHVRCYL